MITHPSTLKEGPLPLFLFPSQLNYILIYTSRSGLVVLLIYTYPEHHQPGLG